MTTKIPRLHARQGLWLAALVCLGLFLQSLSACSQDRPAITAGGSFPLQALETLPRLSRDAGGLAGKTLLINFWATWCAPCREEMPQLQQLSEQLDPARFAVLGVAVDDDANLVREFLLQYRIRFPNFQDVRGKFASDRLGIGTYPQSFVVTPRGVILRRIETAIAWDPDYFERVREAQSDAKLARSPTELDG